MRYLYDYSDLSLRDRICHINGIDFSKLDVSDFNPDYSMDVIDSFKNHLLSFKDKRFFIVGDYDCDGICAITIIKKLLDDLNISNNYYIPSRIKDGYGLNKKIVDNAIDNSFDIMFLVDNGIVAYEEIEYAYNNGLKAFIIDHHEYEHAPKVEAYLHPSLFPQEYKDMCAAGLCALLSNSFRYDEISTAYGGLATLADMVSVLGYNRYLIKNTLELLKQHKVPAINNLIEPSKGLPRRSGYTSLFKHCLCFCCTGRFKRIPDCFCKCNGVIKRTDLIAFRLRTVFIQE